MSRRRSSLLRAIAAACCILVLAPAPAWAVREWYDHYLEARDEQIPDGEYDEAIENMLAAIKIKPTPGLKERTYGLQFEDYLPYYHLGLCYLHKEDFPSAIRMFNMSEDRGTVRNSRAYAKLRQLRTEAVNGESQKAARLARAEVGRLVKEATALFAKNQFQEALTQLAQAQVAAGQLDRESQRQVAQLQERILAKERQLQEQATRRTRIEQELSRGQELLTSGDPTAAVGAFDQVLALDASNSHALSGKQEAQDLILATRTRNALERAFQEGKTFFEAGQYAEAVPPLTDAAASPDNKVARDLLETALKILEGMRQQRELRVRIATLGREAEELLLAGESAQAQVRIANLLRMDPGNVQAKERLAFAEMKIGEALVSRWLPNLQPALTVFAPRTQELEIAADSISIVGVATDDRGISKIEFKIGDRVVAEQAPPPSFDLTSSSRNVRFDRKFPLAPGLNEIVVTATDSTGLTYSEEFRLTRRLRFYETSAFLPSAVATATGLLFAGFMFQHLRRRRAVRRRFNPYIAGAPVMDEHLFFGREKVMARMLNVLHHNSLVITGERRIGKTTFLYHLKRALEADSDTEYRFFPVLTDLQGVPESSFFHTVMSDVLDQVELDESAKTGLRFSTGDEDYDGRDFSHDVRLVIEALKTVSSGHVKLALLIDEVDALNAYSERINQRLRSIFMKTFSEHLVAIMSGVAIKRTWKSEGSPWYNFFDEIVLPRFGRVEAEALIRTPVEGVFRYQPEAVDAIIERSEGKPYLIQKFCIHAVNRIIEERRTVVRADDVERVEPDVLFEGRHPEPRPVERKVSA